jgi:hypothetical protein
MKKQINDLLLKMQTGENCIGETANKLLDLLGVSGSGFYCMDAENSNGSCHCPKQCNSCVGY